LEKKDMAVAITVPSIGESITEGTLSRWLKPDGATVKAGEPIFELETEKATTEVPAPAAGRLKITVQAGETIAIGSVVGEIDEAAAGVPAAPPAAKPMRAVAPARKPTMAAREDGGERKASTPFEDSGRATPAAAREGGGSEPATRRGDILLSPAARRLAEEQGVEPLTLTGTGRGGRVTKGDVLAHLEGHQGGEPPTQGANAAAESIPATDGDRDGVEPQSVLTQPTPSISPEGRETRRRMSSIRQRIADRLVASQQTTATLTTFNEADMSAILALRNQYKDRFREKYGIGLSFMSFFVKASIEALRAFPNTNARIDGQDVVYHHFYNIGVAVSTERGLMVPVVADAERMSFAEIEKRIADVAQKAREGKITVHDLQGGTFTITNGGVFGSLMSTPILNSPQAAILGMHAIQKRPVAINDQVVIRPMMYLALSYDHRLIDGREAVLFLVRIKECIENPERLLLEV
jgi:2-oxoglutarate dehydrogenase E2 component (dihydrolipoamide succinyltransferase)